MGAAVFAAIDLTLQIDHKQPPHDSAQQLKINDIEIKEKEEEDEMTGWGFTGVCWCAVQLQCNKRGLRS